MAPATTIKATDVMSHLKTRHERDRRRFTAGSDMVAKSVIWRLTRLEYI